MIQAVWSVIVDAAHQKFDTISGSDVLLALSNRAQDDGGRIDLTRKKAGMLLRDLGCKLKRTGGGLNVWTIPIIPGVNAPENVAELD